MASRLLLVAVVACSASERGPRPAERHVLVAPGLRLPDDAAPIAYDLHLDLDPEKPTFSGTVAIRAKITKPTDHVWLHADELVLGAATWTGAAGTGGTLALDPVEGDEMRAFRFGKRIEPGEVTLTIAFTGALDHDQEGLFRQRAHGGWYIFSQGESVFARRFTPCFDEPRFKTPWRVTLTVPSSDVALSNMPETATRDVDDQRKEVSFAATGPLPSYLVAIAVGPFELVEVGKLGKAKLPVRVAVQRGEGKRAGIVAAKLPAVIDALERYVGEPLPLAKLDVVAVPHLFGAMENPGLITFDEPMLLGEPRVKPFANNFVLVAAHELAHQWFGNSVTPAWWDDLWLSEGFASWLGAKVEVELGAVDDVELRVALTRREAIAADTGSSAAPLRRPMLHNADPDNSFDEIAYQKAHVVLSTFESYLGEEAFRDVLRAYLKAHAGAIATTADFVAVLRKATNDATATSFDQYVRSTGVPVVELRRQCDGDHKVIAHARDGRTVPVCIGYDGKRYEEACRLVGEHEEIPVFQATCPPTYGNGRAGYYHTMWISDAPHGSVRDLTLKPARLRVVAGDDVAARIDRGELPAADAIVELRSMLDSKDPYLVLGGVAIAHAIDRLVGEPDRAAWSAWLNKHVQGLNGENVKSELAEQLATARLELAPNSFGLGLVKDTMMAVERDLTSMDVSVMLVAVVATSGGDKLFARIADRAKEAQGDMREEFYEALGVFGPAQAPLAVALLGDASIEIDQAWTPVEHMLERPATRSATWRALKPVLPAVVKRLDSDVDELLAAVGSLCDKTERAEVAQTLQPLVADAGKPQLARALAAIDHCIASRSKLGDLAGALAH